jgi:hypothetical protein
MICSWFIYQRLSIVKEECRELCHGRPYPAVHDDVSSTAQQKCDLYEHRYGTSGFLI